MFKGFLPDIKSQSNFLNQYFPLFKKNILVFRLYSFNLYVMSVFKCTLTDDMKSFWTGILHGEFFPQSPQIQDETETGMLRKSFSVETTHGKNNHTKVRVAVTL